MLAVPKARQPSGSSNHRTPQGQGGEGDALQREPFPSPSCQVLLIPRAVKSLLITL